MILARALAALHKFIENLPFLAFHRQEKKKFFIEILLFSCHTASDADGLEFWYDAARPGQPFTRP